MRTTVRAITEKKEKHQDLPIRTTAIMTNKASAVIARFVFRRANPLGFGEGGGFSTVLGSVIVGNTTSQLQCIILLLMWHSSLYTRHEDDEELHLGNRISGIFRLL
jgi:hypothetical protein